MPRVPYQRAGSVPPLPQLVSTGQRYRYVDRVPQRVWRCRCRPPVKAHGVAGLASSCDASFPALCSLSARTVSPDVTGCSGKANRERWRLATTTSMSPEHVCGLRIPTVLTARSQDVDQALMAAVGKAHCPRPPSRMVNYVGASTLLSAPWRNDSPALVPLARS